jgi:tryptophan synthase alpha chain
VNPILRFGPAEFFSEAALRGADGLILPEVPLEELDRFTELYEKSGLARILLVAPTSDAQRIAEIDRASSGFLYCVSMTGVTGQTAQVSPDEHVRRVKLASSSNPVLVGFGISTPEAARRFSLLADGVIVGSSLLQKISTATSLGEITDWVAGFKEAMRTA